MHDAARFAHHAAMVALYTYGDVDVSIVQAIKSAKQLEHLLETFHAVLSEPNDSEPDEQ